MSKFAYFNRFRSHDAVNRRGNDDESRRSDVAHNKTSTARPLITSRGLGPGRSGCVVDERGGGDAQNHDTGGGKLWACCWQMWWVQVAFYFDFCLLNFQISSGASALLSLIEKNASQNHIEHAEAPQTSRTAAQPLTPTIRTPRSLEMRLAMNNDILGDEDLMSCKLWQKNFHNFKINKINFFRCTGAGSNVNSRARPLYIPSNEWSGYNHEPDHQSQGRLLPTVQIQQPKRQPERPTELFLPTKQLENGYANPKSQASTYMEQFWICTKRLIKTLLMI